MDPEQNTDTYDVFADTELDSMITGDIQAVTHAEPSSTEQPIGDTQAPTDSTSIEPAQEIESTEDGDLKPEDTIRTSVQAPGESDNKFAIRTQIAHVLAQKNSAPKGSEEHINADYIIKELRKDLRDTSILERNNQTNIINNDDSVPDVQQNPNMVPIEQVEALFNQKMLEKDITMTLDNFLGSRPELTDPDVRDVFLDYVSDNYKWEGKAGNDLLNILETAASVVFPKQVKDVQAVEQRILKGIDVQEKINTMQFPGGQVQQKGYSLETENSIKELMNTGYSRDEAIALLDD